MTTTTFPTHAATTPFTDTHDAATDAPPANPATSRRNSLATDPRFDSLNTLNARPSRPTAVRRNSDIGGLKTAAPHIAATQARAANTLPPLQTLHTAIRTADSLDGLLAMAGTHGPDSANDAQATTRAQIASLSPADRDVVTQHAANRMTKMMNAAPGQLSKETLNACIDTVGEMRHEPSRDAATAAIASMLNRFEPALEQPTFDKIAGQIGTYSARHRAKTLNSLATNLFKTRNWNAPESLAHADRNFDTVLKGARGIPDQERPRIFTTIAQLLPYYAIGGLDWKRHNTELIAALRDDTTSPQTREAVLPALEQSLGFCEQAVDKLITRDDFKDVQGQLTALRGKHTT